MGAKVMGMVWDIVLAPPKQIVLLALADHADHNGDNIWPSIALIAWKTGYSESQTRRIIHGLVKDGLLTETRRPGTSNIYQLHLERGTHKEPLARCNPLQDASGVILRTTPTMPVRKKRKEPSLEPSKDIAPEKIGAGAGNEKPKDQKPIESTPSKESLSSNPLVAPAPLPSSEKKTVPAAQMIPMKNAIAAAFKWVWPKEAKPGQRTMTENEAVLVSKAAAQLCLAGYVPENIPAIYSYCEKNLTAFGPMALTTNAAKAMAVNGNSHKPAPAAPPPPASPPPAPKPTEAELEQMRREREEFEQQWKANPPRPTRRLKEPSHA